MVASAIEESMEEHFTVLFEEPFWVGLFERMEGGSISICKITFGAEPSEQEILNYIRRNWSQLRFTVPTEHIQRVTPKNPKRLLREAKRQTLRQSIGTKSQLLLKQQQEANSQERKSLNKKMRDADKQRKFEQKQAKRKEKHNGH